MKGLPQLTLVITALLTTATSKVRVVDNGYENVVVVITPYNSENPQLLTRLETILTAASAALFRATRNQLYFREFVIVLPQEWQTKPEYENPLDYEIDEPEVFIDRPNVAVQDNPYVLSYGQCGTEGKFMHLTPNYVLDEKMEQIFGPAGKVFVHEWAHLRYGVFDEYPYPSDEQFYSYRNEWYPTGCTNEIKGDFLNVETRKPCQYDSTGKPEPSCRYIIDRDTEAVASLMYRTQFDNIVEFCDHHSEAPNNLRHNILAPNRHNSLCKQKSIWEVMREHADFKGLAGKDPLPKGSDVQPRFRYVQMKARRRVLVLDTSGSMKGEPLEKLRKAASGAILTDLEDNSFLGLVKFSDQATILSQMKELSSQAVREELIELLPTSADGRTSAGSGLLQGMELLSGPENADGGTIILISDGEETWNPRIGHVLPDIIEKGIVVHAIAFTQTATDKLSKLASDTGGSVIFYSGSLNSTALIDGFSAAVSMENRIKSDKQMSLAILTDAREINAGTPSFGTFYIDSTIGNGTTLTISYTQPISIEITSPLGPYQAQEEKDYANSSAATKLIRIFLGDELTPGVWSYKISTTAQSSSITVNVQSKPRQQGQEILQTHSWIRETQEVISFTSKTRFGLYTEVTRGRTPVLGATVQATVERPDSEPLDLPLLDNGVGADVIKQDGIYSTNVIAKDLTGNGRYNIKIQVTGSQDKTKVVVGGPAISGVYREPTGTPTSPREEPVEDFQRVTTAGEFRIQNFVALDESMDELPPARITNFRAVGVDFNEHKATLVWTAVGGDLERGQASRYIIFISQELEILLENQTLAHRLSGSDVLRGSLSTPSASGEKEEFVVLVQALAAEKNVTVYLTVVAVDQAGNQGEASNVVTLSRVEVPEQDDDDTLLYIGIGVGVGVLVVAVVIGGICYLKSRD